MIDSAPRNQVLPPVNRAYGVRGCGNVNLDRFDACASLAGYLLPAGFGASPPAGLSLLGAYAA